MEARRVGGDVESGGKEASDEAGVPAYLRSLSYPDAEVVAALGGTQFDNAHFIVVTGGDSGSAIREGGRGRAAEAGIGAAHRLLQSRRERRRSAGCEIGG